MAEQVLATPPKRWGREYELIYILRPNVEPEEAEKVSQRVVDVMGRMDGKLTKVDVWGKRQLAYPIRKFPRGVFVYLKFVAYSDLVAELERNLRLMESVLRFQTVRLQDMVDVDSVTVDADDVAFAPIEITEDEEELTTAQRLGMEEPRRVEQPAEAEKGAEGEAPEAKATEASADEGAKDEDTKRAADAPDADAPAADAPPADAPPADAPAAETSSEEPSNE
ncbi:MAG: 30S ribosomal protein S6 [Myxococcota bacterium]